MTRSLLGAISLTMGVALSGDIAVRAAPDARVPVIVELFTSEGCSSCPPADQVLATLVEAQPVAGALVIGLSEHVDYWDGLGWIDPFSNVQFTTRQNDYGRATGGAGNYTPQMVVDGHDEFVGSDRSRALTAIAHASAQPLPLTPTLQLLADGRVHVTIARPAQAANADVWLALTEDHLVSDVTRGENAGHTLVHMAVTRQLTRIGQLTADGSFDQLVPMSIAAGWNRRHMHVVVIVQERGPGRVLGASLISATMGTTPAGDLPGTLVGRVIAPRR
jgi:hypothetical protein